MRKDFFKKNMIIAAVLLMVVCLSGCKIKLAEISASVMAPVKVTTPLEGQYRFKNVQHLEEGKFVDDTGFRTFTAEFTQESARIGLERVETPQYLAKLVSTYEYFVEKFRTNPNRFEIKDDKMEVIRITSEGQSFYEVFRMNEDEIGIVKGNHLITLVKTEFTPEGLGPFVDGKANQLENELLEDQDYEPIAGVLLGLRGQRNEVTEESSYRTLWITNDGEIQEVYEIDNILFPRKEFWKMEVVKEAGKERLEIYAITGTPSNVKEEIVYHYPAEYVDVEFVGNNYLSILTSDEDSYDRSEMTEGMTIGVDGYNEYTPVPIETFYGAAGKQAFVSSLIQATNETEEALVANPETEEFIDSFILRRHHGNWMLESSFQVGDESITVPIALRADINLVTYDELTIPWSKVRERVPQALDAFNAPGNSFMLVRTPKYLLMYRIIKGELAEEPLQAIEIKEEEEIIMAEWARGEFVKRWTDMASREGNKIIFVQNRRP